jgi:hypothetical protein
MKARQCLADGFHNLAKPITVDKAGVPVPFCPGKAKWSENTLELFQQCLVIAETGIAPESGGLADQSDMLNEVLATFLIRWRERIYHRFWVDIYACVNSILSSFSKK